MDMSQTRSHVGHRKCWRSMSGQRSSVSQMRLEQYCYQIACMMDEWAVLTLLLQFLQQFPIFKACLRQTAMMVAGSMWDWRLVQVHLSQVRLEWYCCHTAFLTSEWVESYTVGAVCQQGGTMGSGRSQWVLRIVTALMGERRILAWDHVGLWTRWKGSFP